VDISSFVNQYWTYLTIPAVSALVGFGTNWLAVKMMMYPLEFKGVGRIGWQGVVPANSEKMARVVVDHCVKRIMTQDELIGRVDPDRFIEVLHKRIEPFVEDIVDEVLSKTSHRGIPVSNFVWNLAPSALKSAVYKQVKASLPDVLSAIVEDVREELENMIDLNEIIVDKLGNEKKMLIDIFLNAGKKEFKFIERSGLYFGFPLGVLVMFLWYFFPVWWLLPFAGLLVGYITNALAIYLIQKPLEPVKIGPFTVQGLFIKRQKEVARYFGKVFADDLITAEVVMTELLKSDAALDRIYDLIKREVNRAIENSQGMFKPLTMLSLGSSDYAKIGQIISERAFQEFQIPDKRSLRYLDEAFDIEETVAERVGHLPPEEFFGLLHPVISEDEWKLVAVGALLGLGAGWWQWALLT
jgi:uncharacterized membrane protein YheB (UPF0754 family)